VAAGAPGSRLSAYAAVTGAKTPATGGAGAGGAHRLSHTTLGGEAAEADAAALKSDPGMVKEEL
jgi:hypothetical protein